MNFETDVISVLCVDDNQHVADSIRIYLERQGGFEWKGWLESTTRVIECVETWKPAILLLDLDLPGPDPFQIAAAVAERFQETRVIAFSGHVRKELIERAIEGGAWGYISKNDGEVTLLQGIRSVAAGNFVLSPEAKAIYNQR